MDQKIRVVQGIDHIRLRPSMYVMDREEGGLYQLLSEVLDNSIDEWANGFASRVDVKLYEDGSVSVEDNGRGIPIDVHPDTGMPVVTTVLLIPGAGGKFDHANYQFSSGLHGVGVTVVNALSEYLEVSVLKSNRTYSQRFSRGQKVTDLKKTGFSLSQSSGTKIRWKPDPEIFGDLQYSPSKVLDLLEKKAFSCPGLSLFFDKGDGPFPVQEVSLDSLGVDSYVQVDFESGMDRLVLYWTEDDPVRYSWVNSVFTEDHGTHVSGLLRLVKDAFKAQGVAHDITGAMGFLFSFWTKDPSFRGQSKTRLVSRGIAPVVRQSFEDQLHRWMAQKASAVNLIARRAKKEVKRERTKKDTVPARLPLKLAASSSSPKKRELYLVEGDSAAGTAKSARLPFQEVLPLRGKIPNTFKKKGILDNEEVKAIFQSIGNLDSPRVGKVILLMDPDPDGKHIELLVLSLLSQKAPSLLEKGMVYVVRSPLLVAEHKGKRVFGDSLEDLYSRGVTDSWVVSYLKGHGESSTQELKEYAMDPSTRRLYRVSMDSEGLESLRSIMGSESSVRKVLLDLS